MYTIVPTYYLTTALEAEPQTVCTYRTLLLGIVVNSRFVEYKQFDVALSYSLSLRKFYCTHLTYITFINLLLFLIQKGSTTNQHGQVVVY